MSISFEPQQARENWLLAALSDREYERLIPHLELVSLSSHQVLYDAGEQISHVYFPNQAMISLGLDYGRRRDRSK
jgi:CRP-like cAMP-binding protein